MKNIHVLPTDKPSRLALQIDKDYPIKLKLSKVINGWTDTWQKQNIYITSDEDINENDYIITKDGRLVQVSYLLSKDLEGAFKIILTTDQNLIDNGVQAIGEEFLQWFIKNPSCERVETIKVPYFDESGYSYLSIIPKEEPKQETLNIMEKELKSVITPDGELKVLDGFVCETENRKISFALLEDDSIVINVRRFEESEEEPYTKEITSQVMRLSKLTVALLIGCLLKANVDFEIDADSIIADLNKKNQE
jgi:hypothetical protein